MAQEEENSIDTLRALRQVFHDTGIYRPMRINRYDAGEELVYEVMGLIPAGKATVRLEVERFIGGGFAGQVYRVKVVSIERGTISGLEPGRSYAMKILVPPSKFSLKFRNLIYKIGFQGPFSLQVNPSAARAGALWQKFIRRAARIRFGNESAVVDIIATFVDSNLGACGEISEWIDGRNWRFEVDENLDQRKRWLKGKQYDPDRLGSAEYRAKRVFMKQMVEMLHEIGAAELARQYEWWTCKSQPNVLKRFDADVSPEAGLTAVDFRPGLALLPILPMSPADVKLIFQGIARGSLVQFDRCDPDKLKQFIQSHPEDFDDMHDAFAELKDCERAYRESLIDLTHHHVRLLFSKRLWRGIFDGAVMGWRISGLTDESVSERLARSRLLTGLFAFLGELPILSIAGSALLLVLAVVKGWAGAYVVAGIAGLGLVAPVLLKLLRRVIGRQDLRHHYFKVLTDVDYLLRAFRARRAESLIAWYRAGRVSASRAERLVNQPVRFFIHLLLSVLPVGLHRFLTDARFAVDKLWYIFVRPVRLYFNAQARREWLCQMVATGKEKHMLSDEDADEILSKIDEPFIQKYLQSLAVHLCTLPVTQIVSVAVAWIYAATHPELSSAAKAEAVTAILLLFQVTPVSPGSLTRGLYVLYLVIRERNFRDYNIAVFLGFCKYIGYLAFPIQMTHRYPALARFMAAHWATEAVHIVPVFGEHGALLEHGVFDLFYNRPLTIRRRMRRRAEIRAALPKRAWHAIPIIIIAAGAIGAIDLAYWTGWQAAPTLLDIWPATVLIPMMIGAATTIWAGGMRLIERVKLAAITGLAAAAGYAGIHTGLRLIFSTATADNGFWSLVKDGSWGLFIFTILATISAILTEVLLPEPGNAMERTVFGR